MNKERRKQIDEIVGELKDIEERLQTLKDEEQETYDNMPENMQAGEKGEAMQQVVENLDSAVSSVGEAAAYLEEAGQ
jgi:uncharacterized coiled-coil DUF342 family protein